MGRVVAAFFGDEPVLRAFSGASPIVLSPSGLQEPGVFTFLDGALDPRFTFARGSVANYFNASGVLVEAPINEPRFGYWFNPSTEAWEEGGLYLDSEDRTNLCLQNRTQTNAAWTKSNITATKNVTGLDGASNSACRLAATASNGTCLQSITSAEAAHTLSTYVKRISGTGKVDITLDGGTLWIDITRFLRADRWTRVCQTRTETDPSVGFRVRTSGDIIAVDFVQLEVGSGPSSPIATTGSTVTRVADYLGIEPQDFGWYSDDAGTVTLEWLLPDFQRGTQGIVAFDDGTTDNLLRFDAIQIDNNREQALEAIIDGVEEARIHSKIPRWGHIQTAVFRYGADNYLLSIDGLEMIDQDTDTGDVPAVTRMTVGLSEFSGFIRRIEHTNALFTDADTRALGSRSEPMSQLGTFALGVNLNGLEFGSVFPGVLNTHYFKPSTSAIQYFGLGEGFDHFRLAFRWERIQQTLGGALDATYLGLINDVVDDAVASGMTVILDMHNFGGRTDGGVSRKINSVGGATTADLVDCWEKIAAEFDGNAGILGYDIMNEPSLGTGVAEDWYEVAQAVVTALRDAGSTKTIYLEGHGSSAAGQWTDNDTSQNTDIDLHVVDPDDNMVISAHGYFDSNNSGVYSGTYDSNNATPDSAIIRFQPVLAWAHMRGRSVHLGEFGAPGLPSSDSRWLTVLSRGVDELQAHGVLASPFSGGENWGATFPMRLSPVSGTEALAVTQVYENYISPDTEAPTQPGNLQATSTGVTSTSLTWEASTDNVGVAGYRIRRGGVVITTTTNLSYADTGLDPNTLYSYDVRAFDNGGNESTAATDTVTTDSDVTKPSVVVLTAQAIGSSQVNLSWTAATDDVEVDHYNIYRDDVKVDEVAAGTLTYQDTGLADGTTYNHIVRAEDTSGNEADPSNETTVVTSSLTPTTTFDFMTALDPRVTLTRASTGTYFDSNGVLQTAAINTPRFGYYFDGTSWVAGGLLIDAVSRTNRCLHNRDLTNAVWTKTNGTALKNVTGLDGVASSASRFTATSNNATVLQSITSASTERTASVFIKRLSGTGEIDFTWDGGTTWYKVTRFVDGTNWTKVYQTATLANPTIGIRLRTSGDAVALDFFQEESGGAPSSPIATTSASVTRSPDVVSVTGTNFSDWFNQPEGTFRAEWLHPYWVRADNYMFRVTDGTNNNIHWVGCLGANGHDMTYQTRVAGVTQTNQIMSGPMPNVARRGAYSYATNNYALAIDGLTIPPDTAGNVPTGLNRLLIGENFFGFFREFTFWDNPLADEDLRVITEPDALPGDINPDGFEMGLNLSGLEFGTTIPGTVNVDYFRPDSTDFDYFGSSGKGYTLVRLPFKWERIQPTLGDPLNATHVGYINTILDLAEAAGMRVILDMHNFGNYRISGVSFKIDQPGGPTRAQFAEAWGLIATEFAGHAALAGYDLMNEPSLGGFLTEPTIAETMAGHYQAAIDEIRAVDTDAWIYISGVGSASSSSNWIDSDANNNANMDVLLDDPEDKLIYQAHLYVDSDSSGTFNSSYAGENMFPDKAAHRLAQFLGWCRFRKVPGLLGEFAVPGLPTSDVRYLEVERRELDQCQLHGIQVTAWGGGEFWSNNYFGKLSRLSGVTEVPRVTDVHEDYL